MVESRVEKDEKATAAICNSDSKQKKHGGFTNEFQLLWQGCAT